MNEQSRKRGHGGEGTGNRSHACVDRDKWRRRSEREREGQMVSLVDHLCLTGSLFGRNTPHTLKSVPRSTGNLIILIIIIGIAIVIPLSLPPSSIERRRFPLLSGWMNERASFLPQSKVLFRPVDSLISRSRHWHWIALIATNNFNVKVLSRRRAALVTANR